jgi:hypothetical protein
MPGGRVPQYAAAHERAGRRVPDQSRVGIGHPNHSWNCLVNRLNGFIPSSDGGRKFFRHNCASNHANDVMITISIIEDQRDMRESLAEYLGNAPGCAVSARMPPVRRGCGTFPKENPDVVLMDINLPGMNGIQCVAG